MGKRKSTPKTRAVAPRSAPTSLATRNGTRTQSAQPPLPHFIIRLITCGIEAMMALSQFVAGQFICMSIVTSISEFFYLKETGFAALVINVIISLGFAAGILLTFAINWGESFRSLLRRTGFHRPRLSKLSILVVFIHIAGFLTFLGLQYSRSRFIFSFENYMRFGEIDLSKSFGLLVLTPIKEELVFRGIMLLVFYKRFGPHLSLSVFFASMAFGAVHVLNFWNSQYSYSYAFLQIVFSLLLGNFYTLQYAVNRNIWEPIVLHMVNNLFSSFLPVRTDLDLSDELIFIPFAQTVVIYSILNFVGWRSLYRMEREAATKSDDREPRWFFGLTPEQR